MIWPILEVRAEIQKYFRSFFGSNEDIQKSFWNYLTSNCELRLCADKFVFKTAFLLSDWFIQKQKNFSKFKVQRQFQYLTSIITLWIWDELDKDVILSCTTYSSKLTKFFNARIYVKFLSWFCVFLFRIFNLVVFIFYFIDIINKNWFNVVNSVTCLLKNRIKNILLGIRTG